MTKDITRARAKKINGSLSAEIYSDVYRIIDAFEPVNKFWHTLHENPKQYDAAMRMIEIVGLEEILKAVKALPLTNKIKFFPRIFTPAQLEEKWEMLHSARDDAMGKNIKIKKSKARKYV